MSVEKREAKRHEVELQAEVEVAGEQIAVSTVNVSTGGLGLRSSHDLPAGTEVRVQIFTGETPNASIALRGSVRWSGVADAGRWIAGVRFEELGTEERELLERFLSNFDPG